MAAEGGVNATGNAEGGVRFALRDGVRSSRKVGPRVFADAVRAVDPDLARRIETGPDWRKTYMPLVAGTVAAGAVDAKSALRIAADGVDSLHANLSFGRDEEEVPLRDALRSSQRSLASETVTGEGERVRELEVPYQRDVLRGDALRRKLDEWERAGVIEPSAAAALHAVIDEPAWLDLSDKRFVLLGAASEMGPLIPLSSWGADIVAVDLPRPRLWEQVLGIVRAGAGRAVFPTSAGDAGGDPARAAGVDLLRDVPAVKGWLDAIEGELVIGNYVYADGATFVRLAGAVDVLLAEIAAARPGTALAYLATPTDVYAVPESVFGPVANGRRSAIGRVVGGATRSRLYEPNYRWVVDGENGRRWAISDSLVPIQGANYALAKSLQRWRAMLAREDGSLSSVNVAPATRTRSVTKNRLLAAAYKGAPSFGVEVFAPETSRSVMAALLVHDLRTPRAAARPETALDHPYDLFATGACHGGIWRLPHTARSVLPLGLVLGLVRRR